MKTTLDNWKEKLHFIITKNEYGDKILWEEFETFIEDLLTLQEKELKEKILNLNSLKKEQKPYLKNIIEDEVTKEKNLLRLKIKKEIKNGLSV